MQALQSSPSLEGKVPPAVGESSERIEVEQQEVRR
jgi:hypothetical protein